MKKIKFILIATILLTIRANYTYGQGCSDAVFVQLIVLNQIIQTALRY
jgi:hypothetical protein